MICKHCGNSIIRVIPEDELDRHNAVWANDIKWLQPMSPMSPGLTRELRIWCFPLENTDDDTPTETLRRNQQKHEPYDALETLAIQARKGGRDAVDL